MKIIDISRELIKTPPYPGDPAPYLRKISSMEDGEAYNASVLTACVHCATHADAPCHFIKGGKGIDEIEPQRYLGKCFVYKCEMLTRAEIECIPLEKDNRILLISGGCIADEDAVLALDRRNIFTVGCDSLSIAPQNSEMEVHKALFSYDIAILENLNLSEVEEGEYMISALPIKIKGCDGAFVRAVLWR